MEQEAPFTQCELGGTKYCRMLNLRSCKGCAGSGGRAEALQNDLETYVSLLPEGGVARLFLSRECCLCRGERKGRRNGYAILYMAHPALRRARFVRTEPKMRALGMMIPVQLAVCERCRKRFLRMQYLPTLIPLGVSAAALIVLSLRTVHNALSSEAAILPFGIWAILTILAALVGRALTDALKRRWGRSMYAEASEQPALAAMLRQGWSPIATRAHVMPLFSKSRITRGLGTSDEPFETAEADEPADSTESMDSEEKI